MNNDREKIILETLKAKQSVDVKQLCKLLYASESTVRRTLTNLEKKGLIIRAHGKALDAGVYADKNIAFFLRENVAGGIKEKILVAINNNVKTIYVPSDNKADVKEIDKDIIKGIRIKYINNYLELYNDLF